MQYHMRDYVQALRVLYNGLRVIWGPRVVSSATRGTIKALNSRSTDLHILCNLVLLKIKTFPE